MPWQTKDDLSSCKEDEPYIWKVWCRDLSATQSLAHRRQTGPQQTLSGQCQGRGCIGARRLWRHCSTPSRARVSGSELLLLDTSTVPSGRRGRKYFEGPDTGLGEEADHRHTAPTRRHTEHMQTVEAFCLAVALGALAGRKPR